MILALQRRLVGATKEQGMHRADQRQASSGKRQPEQALIRVGTQANEASGTGSVQTRPADRKRMRTYVLLFLSIARQARALIPATPAEQTRRAIASTREKISQIRSTNLPPRLFIDYLIPLPPETNGNYWCPFDCAGTLSSR